MGVGRAGVARGGWEADGGKEPGGLWHGWWGVGQGEVVGWRTSAQEQSQGNSRHWLIRPSNAVSRTGLIQTNKIRCFIS